MTEFEINKGDFNQISFDAVYHEKVLLRHFQGLYSNFDLTITPNLKNTIKLQSDAKIAQQFLDHVGNEIKKRFQIFTENNISICGFDITTANDKFHAVDSKPLAYLIPILEALDTIFRLPETDRKVIEPKLSNKLYRFEIDDTKKEYKNLEWDSLTTHQLVRPHANTKQIKANGKIIIENSDIDITLESKIDKFNTGLQNRIDLRFRKEQFGNEQMLSYLRMIELIVSDEYKKGINISGFNVYFEKSNNENVQKQEGNLLTLNWCIRNILNSENLFDVINEAYR